MVSVGGDGGRGSMVWFLGIERRRGDLEFWAQNSEPSCNPEAN